jgi:hypothetical protein
MARKPLAGTVAQTVLAHGTGALNVDGCRIEAQGRPLIESKADVSVSTFGDGLNGSSHAGVTDTGRWPANVLLDEQAAAQLDEQTGDVSVNPAGAFGKRGRAGTILGNGQGIAGSVREEREVFGYGDSGGASRFFYVSKASSLERNAGLDGFDPQFSPTMNNGIGGKEHDPETATRKYNVHPTVKPIDVMRWLVRLVTPPGVALGRMGQWVSHRR